MDNCIRIGLVDDQAIFREGVAHALLASTNLTIVAEGETADDAIRMTGETALDVLLLEIGLSGNGIETVRAIRHMKSKVKIVVLTAADDEELVIGALRAGAHGYILKDIRGVDLMHAIESIHRGASYVTPALASRLLSRLVTQTRSGRLSTNKECIDGIDLTSRERQVLGYLSEGLTNREVAAKLGLSVKTIKQHATLLFLKMGVRNRVEATVAIRKSQLSLQCAPI